MNGCIFLDRDGVINRERGDYTYLLEDFEMLPGVVGGIKRFKQAGYKVVVITNQAGIAKERYTRDQMNACHNYLQDQVDELIDHIYYSPYHPNFTESLTRKPNSLMFEKAIAKFDIDPSISWMVGDNERDLIPAKKFAMKTILMTEDKESTYADYTVRNFKEVVDAIL